VRGLSVAGGSSAGAVRRGQHREVARIAALAGDPDAATAAMATAAVDVTA
jgi:hypothetical protein